jgi:predicted RNA-binding Zn-ribbon protein involved in translation (DUF1610 family)
VVACYNCGSTNLHDEDDTAYCSDCHVRTWVDSGEAATRECPECGGEADVKAAYCRQCNEWIADR